MKLQISFDMVDLDKALALATELQEHIDIIEIGSLLIYKHGEQAITRFRQIAPQKTILADLKIVDRSKDAAKSAFSAGADWVTVLAGASKNVIHTACSTAHDMGKKVMLDLIDASSLGQSALEAQSLGVDALLFHRPSEESAQMISLEQWDMVKGNTKLPIFIATQISQETIGAILALKPTGIAISIGDKDTVGNDILAYARMVNQADN